MQRNTASALVLLAGWAALAATSHGQGFGGGEFERYLRPGAKTPYDGASYYERYNYGTGSFFYPNMNTRDAIYLEYLDRLDRAQKFGYRIPQDPFAPGSPYYRPQPARVGLGLGFFRWR